MTETEPHLTPALRDLIACTKVSNPSLWLGNEPGSFSQQQEWKISPCLSRPAPLSFKKKEIKCRSHLDQVYLSAGVQMSFVSEKDGMTAPVPSGGSLALVSMSLFIYFEWLQSGKPQIWESLAQKALGKMPSSPSPTGASQVQDSVN